MLKTADINSQNNIYFLSGELDFSNVMSVYYKSLSLCSNSAELVFDFSQLKNSNSAGLALIVEWIKLAQRSNKSIRFKFLPKNLLSIAQVSGLDKVINAYS